MTKIAISPNVNGTGTFTLAAPDSNTNRTLTLPDAGGTVNTSGQANEVPAGSAAAPSVFPTGDTNTGLFFPASDTTAFATGGSERMRIEASGNVGIGTTEPQCSLQVNGGIRARGGAPGGSGANNNGYAFSGNGGDNDSGMFSSSDGNLDFFTNNLARVNIKETGNVGIGRSDNAARLQVFRNDAFDFRNAHIEMQADSGDVILGFHCSGASATVLDHARGGVGLRVLEQTRAAFRPIAASAFNVNSDYRIKENITPLTGAADRLMQLPVHRFSFVEGSMSYQDGITVDGFLAHEAQAVVAEAVTGDKDAVDADGNPILQAIDQSKLVPLLTAALQEALADIATLKAEVAALKGVPA